MVYGDRKDYRVTFQRGVKVIIMAIDGTWRRSCLMEDASDTGARLTIEDSIEGLNIKEFFLLLSSTGLAYRRCQLVRINGNELGVRFLQRAKKTTGRLAARV